MKKNWEECFRKLKIKQLDLLERLKKLEKRLEDNPDEAEECDQELEEIADAYNKIKTIKDNQAKKMID